MTNIYIPFAADTRTDELRYCLRSISQYLYNYGSINIITTDPLPEFTNITRIQHADDYRSGRKEWNIIDKIRSNASGRFLFMNDDHFFLSEYDAGSFPNYYDGNILSKLNQCARDNPYRHTISNTARLIGQYEKYYDIHCPINMDMAIISKMWLANVNYGYCFKSVYAHYAEIEGIEHPDCKIQYPMEDRKWFSTPENTDLKHLELLFPNKSKYEI